MLTAVVPVTRNVDPVVDSVAGRSARMAWTRSFVFSALGPVDGTAENTAVSPAGLNRAADTETTPSVAAIFFEIVATAALAPPALFASTTTVSGR
jgi:hypothetical protein